MTINRFDDGYVVCLMDPGHLDICDTHTTLRVNVSPVDGTIIDAMSGKTLQSKDGRIDLVIPAGAFRILKIPHKREKQTGNGQAPKAG